jgi:hypothetical protein
VTTQTTSHSVYPAPVAALLPKARQLAADLGEVPSRNRLMTEFKIGAPKATALRGALQSEAATVEQSPNRLHLVPAAGDTANDDTTERDPVTDPDTAADATTHTTTAPAEASAPVTRAGHPGPTTARVRRRPVRSWPVLLLAAPAFVAIWSGWVGLGGLTGFGIVHPLPGIWDSFELNTAITLPIGVETYAAYALRAWLSGTVPTTARRFAKWSAIGSLVLGALGQVAYHLMAAEGITRAPWQITTLVACLPVAVLGMGAALAHLIHDNDSTADENTRTA